MTPNSTQDRLSNLPNSLLEKIFSRLTTREVLRTSVLSTSWRYKWTSFPHLLFNDECIPGLVGSAGHDKLVKIVNHVLLAHTRPILSFRISSSHLQTCPEIDSWVFSLSLLSLTEFELWIGESSYYYPYKVLPNLFSFKHLISLTLNGCIIPEPPSSFKGFSCVRTLFLKHVTVSDAALKCLVSSCPELEKLSLSDFNGATHIEISNPKLKHLRIHSWKDYDLCLNDLKLLIYASFSTWRRQTWNFNNIFPSLLGLQELHFQGYFLESLGLDGNVPKRLPSTFHHLKSISFGMNGNNQVEMLLVLCLLNASPNLRKLEIKFWTSSKIQDLQEVNDRLKSMAFNTLRVVNISLFHGCKTQVFLIKLLLANSPVLETMKVHPVSIDTQKQLTFCKELLQFRRASPTAEIFYDL